MFVTPEASTGDLWEATYAIPGLTRLFLADRFRSRLLTLRRNILMTDALNSDEQTEVITSIDHLLPLWKGSLDSAVVLTSIWSGFTKYAVPVSGFAIAAFHTLSRDPRILGVHLASGDVAVLYTLAWLGVFYGMSVVASSAALQRGLMLEGQGELVYRPGRIQGQGVYRYEAAIFGPLVPAVKDIPLDLVMYALMGPILSLEVVPILALDLALPIPLAVAIAAVIFAAFTVGLAVPALVAWRQRRRLGRG